MPVNLKTRRAKERERATQIRLLSLAERTVARKIKRLIVKAGRLAARQYETDGTVAADKAAARFERAIVPVLQSGMRTVGIVFANRLIDGLGKSGAVALEAKSSNAYLEEFDGWLRMAALSRVKGISGSQRNQIRRIIINGGAEGLGPDAIARNIRKATSGDISAYQAHRIARTEIHAAANAGSYYAATSSGVQLWKEWLATNDRRTRNAHAAVNGQIRAHDEMFSVNGAEMSYPGDPAGGAKNVIMCRCATGWLTEPPASSGATIAPERLTIDDKIENAKKIGTEKLGIRWHDAAVENVNVDTLLEPGGWGTMDVDDDVRLIKIKAFNKEVARLAKMADRDPKEFSNGILHVVSNSKNKAQSIVDREYWSGQGQLTGLSTMNPLSKTEIAKTIAADKKRGIKYSVGDLTKEGIENITVRHEYGHLLTNPVIHDEFKRKIKSEARRSKYKGVENWTKNNLSEYAAVDMTKGEYYEAIAEGFALYTAPYYTKGTLPKWMEEMFLHMLKVG